MTMIPTDRVWNRNVLVCILFGSEGAGSYRDVSLIVGYRHHNPFLFEWGREWETFQAIS